MSGVNKAILIGRLGKDPEIRNIEGGSKVASFTLATKEVYKDKSGNKVEQTEWHNIVVWRSLADLAERFLRKGSQIYLEGKIKTRSWDDKEGNKRYTTEIVGDTFTFLDTKGATGPENGNEKPMVQTTEEPTMAEDDGDLPF
jgi:single-strand DNA-binding protein